MGDTLATLVQEVQLELNQSADPAVGQNFRDHIKNRIRREYRRLYHDYDWPHLRAWEDVTSQAGERYYDYPDNVTRETTLALLYKWGGRWHKLHPTLQEGDYNALDSDTDQRSDPAMKWRPYGATQVEIWPLPDTNGCTLRFIIKRPFTPLVDETDRADLDTDLIVLHAAAELARRTDKSQADVLLDRAVKHYASLKSRGNSGKRVVNMAAAPGERCADDKVYVAVGSSSVSSGDSGDSGDSGGTDFEALFQAELT